MLPPSAWQARRVRVVRGCHEGRVGKVVRVLPDHGDHGFVEVKFDPLMGAKPRKPEHGLVPLPYLAREVS